MDSNTKCWSWNPAQCPDELNTFLAGLAGLFPIVCGQPGLPQLTFEKIDGEGIVSEVVPQNGGVLIRYNQLCAAGRGVGSALAGLTGREETPFTMLGIMLDVSRNLVFTTDALRKIFQRLAILGYNTVLLYAEDTYQLPDEPYFGVMRGRYTAKEIRLADDVAHSLGIELVGCIQTLGHMGQALQWRVEYQKIRDTPTVMMVGAPETKKLIEKMLDFWSKNLRSRRIHLGMDETHDLGRGAYLDRNGYVPGFTLFNEQLGMVNELCRERGLAPMIWSDMYFRLGNKTQAYYDLNSVIPEDVKAKIPQNVQLVYWDYYNTDSDFYEKFIQMHRDLGFDPVMGAGVWIWSRLWYDHELSAKTNRACLAACRKKAVKEVFFTMWGDDGAICHFNSAWTGLTEAADLAFGHDDEAYSAKRYNAMTGSDYALTRMIGLSNFYGKNGNVSLAMAAFWDDLLLGIGWHNLKAIAPDFPEEMAAKLGEIRKAVADRRNDRQCADFDYAWQLLRYMEEKLQFRNALVAAYEQNNRAALQELKDVALPQLVKDFDEFTAAFRRQWLEVGKVFGLETMQHRMGGSRERLLEAGRRLDEYLSGKVANLPELEEAWGDHEECLSWYNHIASGSTLV